MDQSTKDQCVRAAKQAHLHLATIEDAVSEHTSTGAYVRTLLRQVEQLQGRIDGLPVDVKAPEPDVADSDRQYGVSEQTLSSIREAKRRVERPS